MKRDIGLIISVFLSSFLLLAVTSQATATIIGTPANLSGNTDIYDNTTWENENLSLIGNITVYSDGSLSLINTALIFNSTADNKYGINVNQNGKIVIKSNSSITSQNGDYHTWIYVDRGIIQAENSHFSQLGLSKYPHQVDTYEGISLNGINGDSFFINNTIEESWGGIYDEWGKDYKIIGNTFRNLPSNLHEPSGSVGYFTYYGSNITIDSNTFITLPCAVYTMFSDKMLITNNRLDDIWHYTLNIWISDTNGIIRGNHWNNTKRPIVMNNGQRNWLIENNTFENSAPLTYTASIGMNADITGITFRNNTITSLPAGIMSTIPTGKPIYNNTFESSTFTKVGTGIVYAGHDSIFRDSVFTEDPIYATTYGIKLTPATDGTNSSALTFENITLNNFDYGIYLDFAVNNIFKDIVLTGTGMHIYFVKDNSNNKFINTRYDSSKLGFENTNDTFLPYYYLEVKVIDTLGNPVSGADIAIVNEVDPAKTSINRKGEVKTSFKTGSNGLTKNVVKTPRETFSDYFSISPNEPYQFGGWVKVDTVSNPVASVNLSLYEYDSNKIPLTPNPINFLYNTWTDKNVTFTTQADTKYARIMLDVPFQNTQAWFDDIYVNYNNENILSNAGFESGSANWTAEDNWRRILDSTEKHSGTTSYKVIWQVWEAVDADIPVILDYSQTQTSTTDFTYTITAKKDGKTAAITGLDIDESWYRPNPEQPTKTVILNIDTGAGYIETNYVIDLDQNGVINILDIVLVAQHFGESTTCPDACPVPNYDIDSNGSVNILDIRLVAEGM